MKSQFPNSDWYTVFGTFDVPEFTEAILNHKYAGNWFEILFHNLMKGVKWWPADPSGEARIVCCTGTIEKMGVSGDTDIYIALKPNDCPDLMVPTNEGELECEIPWADRGPLFTQLLNIKTGGKVKICGYWTKDYGHPKFWDFKNEIHDITDIQPL